MPLGARELPLPSLQLVSFDGPHGPLSGLADEALFAATATRILFTTRAGGVSEPPYDALNLGDHVNDDLAAVEENRRTLMEAMGVDAASQTQLIVPKQVHGDAIVTVGEDINAARLAAREGADGIVCSRPGVPVLLCFADCVPVIIVAPNGAYAVLHAGWRGALAGIPGKGLAALAEAAGCAPQDCNAYVGPHIGACCYETSQEILDSFTQRYGAGCDAGERKLDLSFAVKASLLGAGAVKRRIVVASECTSCNNELFYSYRADGGVTGRHGAFAYRGAE